MTMKHCTKSSRRRSEHQLFHTLHPYGSTKIPKKLLDPLILPIQTSTNDNEASYKVSSLYNQASQRRSEHKLFHTLHPSWIHHNSKKNYWILLSWQYAHLLMIMKHCTKFQVSTASRLRGEVRTKFCDRLTDGLTEGTKTICLPQDGGDIILVQWFSRKNFYHKDLANFLHFCWYLTFEEDLVLY